MIKLRAIHVPLLLVALLLSVWPSASMTAALRPAKIEVSAAAASQTEPAWLPLAPAGEEFSAMTPAPPSLMILRSNYAFERDGERVLEHKIYSGYANGFIFIIESARAKHPQRISEHIGGFSISRVSFTREVMIDGYMAREYRRDSPGFLNRVLWVVTKNHVYVLTLAARDEKNTFPERFLSSFKLSDQSVKRTPVVAGQPPASAAVIGEKVFSGREVTRKAAVVWKPEPAYTEQARRHQLTGTILLSCTFGADGQVSNITVLTGLKDGLTENAIEAARNIRFFPAEKDGRLVSQELKLEYNFNLY